jgi:DNA-binding transcriptional LysR family regulator
LRARQSTKPSLRLLALCIKAALSECTYFFPDVMMEFQDAHPRVTPSRRSVNSMQVLKMVPDGEADIGVARSLNHLDVLG